MAIKDYLIAGESVEQRLERYDREVVNVLRLLVEERKIIFSIKDVLFDGEYKDKEEMISEITKIICGKNYSDDTINHPTNQPPKGEI